MKEIDQGNFKSFIDLLADIEAINIVYVKWFSIIVRLSNY